MAKIKYLWQNLSLKNLPGEKWRDIPRLEYYFQISNFGRVKRLEYEIEFKDGRRYTKYSQIIKPTLNITPNHFVGDEVFFLRTTLNLFGSTYNFSISRMVYFCFVSKFDLYSRLILITHKDGDSRNIKLSNLVKISMHDLHKRVIAQKRTENILLRPDIRRMSEDAIREKLGKQISQYTLNGKKLKTFNNISEAAKAIGISKGVISGVLRGRKVTAGGFAWRYGKALKIDFQKDLQDRKLQYKKGLRKEVAQYNSGGKRIGVYNSIEEASRQTNICSMSIGKVVLGTRKSAGGYYWKANATK
jgi:hypothetical protein